MFDAIKPLIDSGVLNEETKAEIEKAWQKKLNEARDELAAEMRSEFANRYEHDKNKLVQALDQMVNETLSNELEELAEEKASFLEIKAKHVSEMKAKARAIDTFVAETLRSEIKELREDRKRQESVIDNVKKFVTEQLDTELREFNEDKQDLAKTKVKLVSESRKQLAQLKKDFVTRSSKTVKEAVTAQLKKEIKQLQEDITKARENNFGRRLFEAFATEFSASHLNENVEIRKLKKALSESNEILLKAKVAISESKKLAEQKELELAQLNENVARNKKLAELLKPLSNDKAEVMTSLLESVRTDRLENAFKKYLPAVMDGSNKGVGSSKKHLNESVLVSEKTGNRPAKIASESNNASTSNIVELKRLAGL